MKNKVSKRECGNCTACCDGWLVINTDSIKAYPGKPCAYSVNNGCEIYQTRPERPCRTFNCSWVMCENDELPDWLKPSNSKAIVVNHAINWYGNILDLVLPVGRKVPQRTLNWLVANARHNNRPFVCAEHEVKNKVFTGAKTIKVFAHQPLREKLIEWLNAGNTLW